jgi:hypothetical protein
MRDRERGIRLAASDPANRLQLCPVRLCYSSGNRAAPPSCHANMFSYQDANHHTVGPLPTDAIRQLVAAGVIRRHTLMRTLGTDFWQPAAQFAEFKELFDQIHAPDREPTGGPEGSGANADEPSTPPAIDITAEVSPEAAGGAEQAEPAITEAGAKKDSAPTGEEKAAASSPPEPPPSTEERYFMIGGDGREYGPVTAGQLREWISQRRANRQTRIRRERGREFSPLGDWPEFADLLDRSGPASTTAPPPLDSGQADQLAAEIIDRGINLSVSACFSRSWKLYTAHWGLLTATTALAMIIIFALHLVPAVGNVAAVALGGVFSAGLSLVFLKTIRGRKAEVNDVVAGFNRGFVPLLLASTVIFVLLFVGYFLCVLPGIYLTVAWLFAYPLIFERSLDFWPAMEVSRKVVHERWWEFFGLALGAAALVVLGLLVAVVGVFFTAPIAFGAIMYAYEDIFGQPREAGSLNSEQ